VAEVRITAEPRTEFGKGAARRVRRAAKVPAVLYGHGEAPRHVSLPGHELMLALKGDSNVLLTLETEDGDQLALPKVVVRDPIKGFLEHVDLIAVRKGEKVTVDVPLVLTGEAAPETLVDQQHTTISVSAEATHIPTELTVDITGLSAGHSIPASAVVLPAGTTLELDPESVVVAGLGVISEEALEAELDAAEAELGAGQAGAAAAEDGAEAADGEATADAADEPTSADA
jgi:large subunit ribosomal protein L25